MMMSPALRSLFLISPVLLSGHTALKPAGEPGYGDRDQYKHKSVEGDRDPYSHEVASDRYL
ncbi:MAG: hypothetical protein HC878_03520 [Leptolyngbyaceae cyanobacterium SL_5_14]|nr:hypothetical protein [Leptolyngbyaceae cyanobacterium SL_5_14]